MRLFLAVAVLMLAFVAYTEAEAREETIEQKFAAFAEQLSEMRKTLAENVKTTFESVKTSDLGVRSSNWFQEQYDQMKIKFGEITQ